jgi:hypothetical protein
MGGSEKFSSGSQGWLEAERRHPTNVEIGFLRDMHGDRIGYIQMRHYPTMTKDLWKETSSLSEKLGVQVDQQIYVQ